MSCISMILDETQVLGVIEEVDGSELLVSVPTHSIPENYTESFMLNVDLGVPDERVPIDITSTNTTDKKSGLEILRLRIPEGYSDIVTGVKANSVDRNDITSRNNARHGQPVPARGHYTEDARKERVDFIRRQSQCPLEVLDHINLSPESLTGNIENLIGSIEIPVGLAGPLLVRGQSLQEFVYAPLATTEGALVASTSRGAKALTRCGGVFTRVLGQRMFRVPMFVLADSAQAEDFVSWMNQVTPGIRRQIQAVSSYAKLSHLDFNIDQNKVHVYFVYQTGDSAGQNMTTACTWRACQWILRTQSLSKSFQIREFYIDSNMSGDKKANTQSLHSGRGTWVEAQCVLSRNALMDVLNVTSEQLMTIYHSGRYSAKTIGMLGFNINIANIIASIFAATGQDIACVHECSIGELRLQQSNNGDLIWASINLPALIVGTVGGGTHLPGQGDYLSLMGCSGKGKRGRLAEIIAAYCLALDISTLAAVASGEFALAHERLGRNRPVKWFTRSELNREFFENCFRTYYQDPKLLVSIVSDIEGPRGVSIITDFSARRSRRFLGLYGREVTFQGANREPVSKPVMVKIKPLDKEVLLTLSILAASAGPELGAAIELFRDQLGFTQCHRRELALYQLNQSVLKQYMPIVYQCIEDREREAYIIVMEKLVDMELLDCLDTGGLWGRQHIQSAITALADIHALYLQEYADLAEMDWMGCIINADDATAMKSLWENLARHANKEFPELYTDQDVDYAIWCIDRINDWWSAMDDMPKTLVHNDFNPRNVAFRKLRNGTHKPCIYDWELATIHIPQRDLLELLCFTVPAEGAGHDVSNYVELHRRLLEERSGKVIAVDQWRLGCVFAFREFYINRLGMYLLAHSQHHYKFMPLLLSQVRVIREIDTEYSTN